jgi:hypothetical protein
MLPVDEIGGGIDKRRTSRGGSRHGGLARFHGERGGYGSKAVPAEAGESKQTTGSARSYSFEELTAGHTTS